MDSKTDPAIHGEPIRRRRQPAAQTSTLWVVFGSIFIFIYILRYREIDDGLPISCEDTKPAVVYPFGHFPKPDDAFRFLPCTNATVPPALDDVHHEETWTSLYDPNPENWSWGNKTAKDDHGIDQTDPYAGRSIYLCGYLDVPLDYGNSSDTRIVRLGITKLQVSGLNRIDRASSPKSGQKSERTIVINPGGPGGSGTEYTWRTGEATSQRLSDGKFDVLGFDPRGLNTSLPTIGCFPYKADRDHWSLYTSQSRETSPSPRAQLEVADAMNDAIFRGCLEMNGDLPRFMTTALVARDVEQIRLALGEEELTAFLVSYGTGIGQTYVNMHPNSAGRVILDGTEYVRDHRELAGFGWTALDNATDAWHDGFLGECVDAGPKHCALAKPVGDEPVTVEALEKRMETMLQTIIERPLVGYTNFSGPSLVTYSALVDAIYSAMYNPHSWPSLAQMLFELECGNTTLAAEFLEHNAWRYDPTLPPSPRRRPDSDELGASVICGDAYDAPLPADGLDWWDSLWTNMTSQNWIAGNSRFLGELPCQQWRKYWPEPAEVYRGDLNHTLRHPTLLIAEIYDPATPLRNGRRLLTEMGDNARMIVHHGYGHSSGRDPSSCTDSIAQKYILTGELPSEAETACHADEKPYRYGGKTNPFGISEEWDPVRSWIEHVEELEILQPRLLRSV